MIHIIPGTALGADERRKLLDAHPGYEIRRAGSCFALMPKCSDATLLRDAALERFAGGIVDHIPAQRMPRDVTDRR